METKELTDALAKSTWEIVPKLRMGASGDNAAFSPLSLHELFALIANGADHARAEDLKAVLHLGEKDVPRLNGLYQSYHERVRGLEGEPLKIANAIWLLEGSKVDPVLAEELESAYMAKIATFDSPSDAALRAINDWTKEATRGRIEKLLDSLSPEYRAVLADAIAFDGKWELPFDPKATRDHAFASPGGSTTVRMMNLYANRMEYTETKAYQALRVPFSKGEFSMTFVLPRKASAADWLSQQTVSTWAEVSNTMKRRRGSVSIPRFKVVDEHDLLPVLTNLGHGKLFSPGTLTNFAPSLSGVPIGKMFQKVMVEVDEQGARAAAVSGAAALTSAPVDAPFEFIADRPFVFSIEDAKDGKILFVGLVNRP